MGSCRHPAALAALTTLLLTCCTQPERGAPSGPEGGTSGLEKPVNLLFIITDQQRFDALSRAGNTELATPNLDRLAREGAYFVNAYTPSPICVPARTSILTGHSLDSTRVTRNSQINRPDATPLATFDSILSEAGYHAEYYGKWHADPSLAASYRNPGEGMADTVQEQAARFRRFVTDSVPSRPARDGELLDSMSGRPYLPDLAQAWRSREGTPRGASRPAICGRLDLPSRFGRTAFVVTQTLQALERLQDRPFSLTSSIGPPHSPFLVSPPYHDMYPPESLELPPSLTDPMTNSPYRERGFAPFRDPDLVRRSKSNYYGLVREVDVWVGKLLDKLKELDLEKTTLVVFTSDHGEMLGDHGMHGKGVLYEGAVRIPLLIRLPGKIPANTVVETPVSTLDLFATILDYAGQPAHDSQGRSLRSLIQGTQDNGPDFCVAQRPADRLPNLMVRTRKWKLLFPSRLDSRATHALYDLENDPHELRNLIGADPDREQYRDVAEQMKGRLVSWLQRVGSPKLEQVRLRPVLRPRDTP